MPYCRNAGIECPFVTSSQQNPVIRGRARLFVDKTPMEQVTVIPRW